MSFTHWLSNHLGLSPRPASRSKIPAARRTVRPTLESLENRWVPSTLTVLNNLDSGAGSLRAEITAARSGDTIVFAPILDGQTITLTSGELLIKKNLTIAGPGAGELTVSGNNASRVFEVPKLKQVTLSGLTISNSYSGTSGSGGAIENYGILTVSNITLSNNSAFLGGGIYNHATGTLTVSNSILSNNISNNTGAGINNDGTLTVSGSTLSGNTAMNDGGGIANGGTVTVSGSTLSGNSATFGGGGIWNNGTATVSGGSFLSSNSATHGGGILNEGTLTVSGSTLSDNHGSYGGGIFNYSTLTVSGSTLSGNSATSAGGGIYNTNSFSATVTVENSSSITGNTAPLGFGADVYNQGVLYLDSTSIIGILDGNAAVPI